ncbi:MAG TPA: helix-turn-helix transcriptional regulator [Caulobacteraceae bacterium]|nr:helix-turn-helix transcriptional regulator [Caulobacteraceae bacterium]
MPLRDKILALRSRSRESLQQVADAVGISKAHIWELETGRSENPSLEILKALATHFRVTLAYLVDDAPLGEARAQHFFRRNEGALQDMSDEDMVFLEDLMKRFSERK